MKNGDEERRRVYDVSSEDYWGSAGSESEGWFYGKKATIWLLQGPLMYQDQRAQME